MFDLDVDAKVGFLSRASAYPERPRRVEVIETHFSWVFLTEQHVYKLKKPLRGDSFDFTGIAARRHNAKGEVCLNRRLAGDIYLGVVPLTQEADGRLAITGNGAIVDWLVQMVRLPAGRMLDRCLADGSWRPADIRALGDRLARFYATAAPANEAPQRYLRRFAHECSASLREFAIIARPELQNAAARIVRRLRAFMRRRSNLLERRVRERRIIEGHGDLRPEHVWLGRPVRIIDCLELRRELRLLDPVDEIAFLAMECARLGAPQIERILFERYRLRTGDAPPQALVRFYKGVRALIRARIAICHLKDPDVRDPAKWLRRAADYLALAERESSELSREVRHEPASVRA
ncbi:MAG TPA: hypothetical protein VNN09_15740 [Candidatus Competibacteraceae bacterium]|nr:hypothetical protein [Candidatus Competibacteraceae bacterium]